MSDTPNQTQFTPWITNGGWTYWPSGRRYIALTGLVTLLASIPVGMILVGIGFALICLLLILKSPINRQFVYHAFTEQHRNYKERRRDKKRGPYRTRELRDIIVTDDEGNRKRQVTNLVQPNIIPLNKGESGFLTEIHTPDTGSHTLYVMAGGLGPSISGSPEDVVDMGEAFASVLKVVDADYGDSGLTGVLFFDRRPTNAQSVINYYERKGVVSDDPSFQAIGANLRERIINQIDTTGDLQAGVAICLPRPRSWNKAKSLDTLPTSDVVAAPAYRATELLMQGLPGIGTSEVHRPTPFEAALLIRGGLDVTQTHELYLDYDADITRQKSGELASFDDSLLMQGGILPDDWSPMRSYLRIGDSFTRMFFVPNYPDRRVLGGVMQQLFEAPQDIWYGISIVYQTMGNKGERYRNRMRRFASDAKQIERAKRGSSSSAEQIDQESSIREADTLLFYSGGRTIKQNLLTYVSASSLAGLEEASTLLRQIFRDVNLPLQPVVGRSLQIPVRLAMLGINQERV